MGIWSWINPWGALRRSEAIREEIEEDLAFIKLERDRVADRLNAMRHDLNTATLRVKMQKEEIMRLNAIIAKRHTKRNPKTGRFEKGMGET